MASCCCLRIDFKKGRLEHCLVFAGKVGASMQLAANCTLVVCRRIVGCSFCLKPAAMSRLENTATLDDVRKCIRSELSSIDVSKLETDNEAVAGNHMSFLLALMKLTLRPGGPMLSAAAQKAFPQSSTADCRVFGQTICNFMQNCRNKAKSMSSGVKLTPNLKTLCLALKHANGADSQSSKSVEHQPRLPLWVGNARRRLKRTQSGSSAAGTPKVEKKQNMSLLLEMLASISKTSSASSSHRNECIVIPDSPPKQPQKIFSVPWLDHQDMTLKRLSREADGKMIEESAEMLEGDNGFVFVW